MLRLNSNNQIASLYFHDNKKQTTIVLSSCHLNATVNHLRSTSTYTSYFTLLLLVTKYYKSAVHVGGDSVKSDQTFICNIIENTVFLRGVLNLYLTCLRSLNRSIRLKKQRWTAVLLAQCMKSSCSK